MPGFFDDPNLTYRMSMLPFATYADPNGGPDHLGFAVPGMISEPINALYRLAQNSVDENGNIAIPNPENPQNQQDVLTGLLSMYGGNALNPARLAEGAAIRDGGMVAVRAEQPHLQSIVDRLNEAQRLYSEMPRGFFGKETPQRQAAKQIIAHIQNELEVARSAGGPPVARRGPAPAYFEPELPPVVTPDPLQGELSLGYQPQTVRAYRGHQTPAELFGNPSEYSAFWASSDPTVANAYASQFDGYGLKHSPAVAPVEMTFTNPLTVDAGGAFYDSIPVEAAAHIPGIQSAPRFSSDALTTDEIADMAASLGHDGVILRNIRDENRINPNARPANSYVALNRGTVRSPLTGETLYSGAPLLPVPEQEPDPYRNSLLTY